MTDAILNSLSILFQRCFQNSSINYEVKGHNENYDEDCRKKMTPNVNTFIMNLEQTSKNSSRSGKVDTISMSDIFVVDHEFRSS